MVNSRGWYEIANTDQRAFMCVCFICKTWVFVVYKSLFVGWNYYALFSRIQGYNIKAKLFFSNNFTCDHDHMPCMKKNFTK